MNTNYFNLIGIAIHTLIVCSIIYKVLFNFQFFDYFLIIVLFWYIYAFFFESNEILKSNKRDCIIFFIVLVALLIRIRTSI